MVSDLVEVWGVEPQSENQTNTVSPSAVYVLTFPPSSSHRQDIDFGSFMRCHCRQSLGQIGFLLLLSRCSHAAEKAWGRLGALRPRVLQMQKKNSYCQFVFCPVVRRFRAAARFCAPPYSRRNQYTPIISHSVRAWNGLYPAAHPASPCRRACHRAFCPCTIPILFSPDCP